jgi:agmatine deiminase
MGYAAGLFTVETQPRDRIQIWMNNKLQMLPEWTPQQAVLVAWPHESTDWAPWLDAIGRDYVELTVAIAREATPLILCQNEVHQRLIETQLGERCLHPPRLVIAPYNDTWCRDYGPITLGAAGKVELLDFCFRGWGDKYEASLDNDINQRLAAQWQAPLHSIDYELEGGSIETDGCGTLLTTTHCLLDSNRNTQWQREDVERFVLDKLGLDHTLWISEGALLGDDTDSHIDNLVRFCSEDTIAYISCTRREDVHYEPLRLMQEQVIALRRPDGSPYKLYTIDLPEPQFDEAGKRLPGSYVNFLILNGSVLVPVFGCLQDAQALNTLQQCFPGKRIVPVPGGNLIRQFGGPHCATMQLPVGVIQNNKE